MTIKIGTNSISKAYIGGNEVSKIYLGTNIIYSKTLSPWLLSDGGANATRQTFPYTIPAYQSGSSNFQDITANSEFSMTGIETTSTYDPTTFFSGSVDSVALTNGICNGYRDCTVKLLSCMPDTYNSADMIFDYYSEDYGGEYFKLTKEGKIDSIVNSWEEYTASTPDNFMVYDSVNNAITLKAGTYDASITENVPVTIAQDVVLNFDGYGYRDSNYAYYYPFEAPHTNTALITKSRTIVSNIQVRRSSSVPSTLRLVPYSAGSYNTTTNLPTSYTNWNPNTTVNYSRAVLVTSSSSSSYTLPVNSYIDIKIFMNNAAFLNRISDTNYDHYLAFYSFPNNANLKIGIYTIINTSGNTQLLQEFDCDGVSKYIRITDTTNPNFHGISIRVMAKNNATVSSIWIDPEIYSVINKNYSKPVTIQTQPDWEDPTVGQLNIQSGYKTGLYCNCSPTSILSFTNQPLYEEI